MKQAHRSPQPKLLASPLVLIALLFAGCLGPPKVNYSKAIFDKVFFPGTELQPSSETATIQALRRDGRFDFIVVHSVNNRPIFCKVSNTGKLLDTSFASAIDASMIIERPKDIQLFYLFHPTPYERCPLPLFSGQRGGFVQFVLPPGDHVLELAFDDMGVSVPGGFRSQGTTKLPVKVEPGKTYTISLKGTSPGFYSYQFEEFPK